MVDERFPSLENDRQKSQKSTWTLPGSLQRSELSSDVKYILELDLDDPPLEADHLEKPLKPEKRKCCPTVLGGANTSSGNTTTPRICSALHCRNCDMSVISFPNHDWTERVEYLFLRTNMPNFKKVSEKLRRKDGTTAYACHCVSFSTEKLRHLHEVDLPWFCRGH